MSATTALKELLSLPISKLLTDRTTFYLEPTATIEQAVQLLTSKQILSAPILLKKNTQAREVDCLGFVDVLDCIEHVLEQVDKHLKQNVDFKAFKNSIMYSDVSSILNQSDRNPFIPTWDNQSLETVVPILSSGVHRLPIFNTHTKTLVGILSQSDFVLLLASVKSDPTLAPLMKKTVQDLGYPSALLTSGTNEMVYDILRIMKTEKVSAVPLVNEKSELVGCFSASDIKSLSLEQWTGIFQDVHGFLAERHPESLTPICIRTNSTFSDVLSNMEQSKVHRVFVVDDEKKPVGVISMTDLIKWLNEVLSEKSK